MTTDDSLVKDLTLCPYIKTVKEYTRIDGSKIIEERFGACAQNGCPYYLEHFEVVEGIRGCCRKVEAEFDLGCD